MAGLTEPAPAAVATHRPIPVAKAMPRTAPALKPTAASRGAFFVAGDDQAEDQGFGTEEMASANDASTAKSEVIGRHLSAS